MNDLHVVRDTNTWYIDQDPMALVDSHIIQFIGQRAGHKLLDYGCGTGGYDVTLQGLGFEVEGADINEEYVKLTKKLGIEAKAIKNNRLPYKDKSFDTVFLVEVIEHLNDEQLEQVLKEAKRVARKNVLITTPNSSANHLLTGQMLTYSHMLERDHKQFYTRQNLQAKLGNVFKDFAISEANPIYPHKILPLWLAKPISALYKAKMLKPALYYRFYIEANV